MSDLSLSSARPLRWARPLSLALLVVLADLLFWDHPAGLSLAIFAVALFLAAVWRVRPLGALAGPSGLLVLAALPVVELAQPLAVLFLGTGLVAALGWAAGDWREAPLRALRLAMALPGRWVAPLNPVRAARMAGAMPVGPGVFRRQMALWAFPLGGSAVFVALLMDANPVLSRLFELDLDLGTLVQRLLFWGGIGLLVAPFLGPVPEGVPVRLRLPGLGLSAGPVIRALVLFNLVIGVQTVTDAGIFLGGAKLPEGMSFADYAHRGAYPLLATAMLAGAFALAARPFLTAHPLIRPLLVLWLGQNLLLCGAAVLRLDYYVGAYGLTYLRVHAFLWMGLVAGGLALCLWQVLAARTTGWLLARVAGMAAAVLYLCCFVNFAQIIAADAVSRPRPDIAYACSLGPMAAVALRQADIGAEERSGSSGWECSARRGPVILGWRDWGFRAWRVRHSLAALEGSA